jgi:serine/threonine protein kinase/tetratricopeptide (TPR) repeat protein
MNDPQRAFEQSPKVLASTFIGDKPPEQVGSVIGPYKLLQQIGEGGFGVVYMAEQEKPVRRTVALKIIKPGMDTGQVIARFESERQALALMDHPNIARVLDAGATASGHPYFVMELVKGVPITEFCDKNHLATEARLKLFLDVCHAIQHAHHKGVIHRDIKPSNVMVTLHDGVPAVKVIDFGVAKATVQKLTEKTLFTAYGQMVGTPAYMSPEQAEMSGLDIDTRSDIYSLGVLLYELLTGTTPIEANHLREAGYAEMQRLIREEESPRPSKRLSSLGDSATVLAGNRGLDVKRLAQLLAGDLDWMVMKALEKDRDRRYGTPGNFAEDIERYLRHEAILARPPSNAYRLKKLAQRNRAAVLTAAVVAVALLAGTAVATWQAFRATRAETAALVAAEAEKKAKDDALIAAEAERKAKDDALIAAKAERKAKDGALVAAEAERKAKDDALIAAKAERKAKDDAFAREAEIKGVLGFVENRVFAAARPEGSGGLGRAVTLRKAIESALPSVDQSFPNQPLIEARLRLTLGQSFSLLGDDRTAAEQAVAARALYARYRGPDHPETLNSMDNLAWCYYSLGRNAEALRLFEETLALRKAKLGPEHPDTLKSMNSLANCWFVLGRRADALKLNEETLALQKAKLGPDHPDTHWTMDSLAKSYLTLGRPADALNLFEKNMALYKAKLGPDHRETLGSMSNVAMTYCALGRYGDAIKLGEETLAVQKAKLGPDHPETLRSMGNLALSYQALGRYGEAIKLQEETLALNKAKLGPDHRYTLTSMSNLAWYYEAVGRYSEALKLGEETLALRKAKLGPDHPDTLTSMSNVADGYAGLNRHAEALKLREETLALRKAKLGPDHPDTFESMNSLALSYEALGRPVEALKLGEETLALRKAKLGLDHPDTLLSMYNLANFYEARGRPAEALKLHEETLARRKAKLGPDHPDTLLSMGGVAACLVAVHRGAEAVPVIDECVQRAAGKDVRPDLLPRVIELRLRHFEKTKDAAGCRQTVAMWEKLNRTDLDSLYKAGCLRAVTAAVLHATNKSASAAHQADAEADRAMAWLTQSVAAGYKDAAHMKQDNDLDSLRAREDFKKLVAELEPLKEREKSKP